MQLKEVRVYKKFTQKKLADKAGITQAYISCIETGKRRVPERTQTKIETALNMTGLIDWEDVKES